jgi:uncharacterized membrane protein
MKHFNAINSGNKVAALESMVNTVAMESFNLADLTNRGK